MTQIMERAAYTILGSDRDGQPLDIPWCTPHMPAVQDTVCLPDREAPDWPWRAMIVLAIAHFPDRTEVALSAAEDLTPERERDVFEQASAFSAEAFAR